MDTFGTRPHLELASGGGERLNLATPAGGATREPATLTELLDAESRLLARATGEHLPLELALQVDGLRAQRARLGLR